MAAIISKDMGMLSNMASYVNIDYMNELVDIESGESSSVDVYFKKGNNTEKKAMEFQAAMEKEYNVLERPDTKKERDEIRRKFKKDDWDGAKYVISSLDENFGEILGISNFLNVGIAVTIIILFSIILVGIGNTIRMTIYERTKEIGTMRALGMQKGSVKSLFVLEAGVMSLIASIAGLLISTGIMAAVSSVKYDGVENFFAMFLKNRHIYFKINFLFIGLFVLALTGFVIMTGFLTARRASEINPAKAIHKTF